MIRKMTIADYEDVFRLWKSTGNMGLRSLDDSKEGIEFFLKRNPDTNFVAVESDIVVGVILSGHDGRRGYIYHTVVANEHRRQGVGKLLVEAAVAALQQEGITRVCLDVMTTNDAGKKFWENMGWENKDFLDFYSKSITDKENLPLFSLQ